MESSERETSDTPENLSLTRRTSASFDFSDTNSIHLNDFDEGPDAADVQGISLLRQIFPEESTEELKSIHFRRLQLSKEAQEHRLLMLPNNNTVLTENGMQDKKLQLTSSELIHNGMIDESNADKCWREAGQLPGDFLCLPKEVAVRRFNAETERWHYHFIADLANSALLQHNDLNPICENGEYFTRVLERDDDVGLGMTLCLDRGTVRIFSVTTYDGRRFEDSKAFRDSDPTFAGPSIDVDIQPGDILIGIDGVALLESCSPDESLLRHAASAVRFAIDPVVLHMYRVQSNKQEQRSQNAEARPNRYMSPAGQPKTQSLLDTSSFINDSMHSPDESFRSEISYASTPMLCATNDQCIHPFVVTLKESGLMKSFKEERAASDMLDEFGRRTRQWEATSSMLIPSNSTSSDMLVPLFGVRKALCVRIVNMFADGSQTAYTLWVYDVETGKEWYAPVRYMRDFQDLRSATILLSQSVANITFPTERQPFFRALSREEKSIEKETKCLLLEAFIRTLCSFVYRDELHHNMAEIAIHVQSFLGCDCLSDILSDQFATMSTSTYKDEDMEIEKTRVRLRLKRSIQRYTYRLFLLDSMSNLVSNFVMSVRKRGPRLHDIENLVAKGTDALKSRALEDLTQLQAYLDKLQDMILEGCIEDFKSIAERSEYAMIHDDIRGSTGYWDRLVREAVREQVEIEVYVPLRSIVSRWLVNGWRHEDMEVQFKIKELRKRPQSFFRIPENKRNRSNWSSVSRILNEGVGFSTLPCAKLRAIVEAAREISHLFQQDQMSITSENTDVNVTTSNLLGADDFLPIFIYCMVRSDMERPCALCVLLRTLCDRINKIGEIGYYLASFEAAIIHFQEVDLAEERKEMHSFLSVPLDDT